MSTMNFGLELVTPQVGEVLTVADLQSQLRIEGHDADNALIGAYIVAAREYFEARTGLQLLTATWLFSSDRFPGRYAEDNIRPPTWRYGVIRLPKPPLQSVTLLQYVDTDLVLQTLAASEYQVSTRRKPGRVAPAPFKVWPVTDPLSFDAVRVTMVCGFGTAAAVPERCKQAIKLLVGHLYENREDTVDGALGKIPLGLESFIRASSYGEVM